MRLHPKGAPKNTLIAERRRLWFRNDKTGIGVIADLTRREAARIGLTLLKQVVR